MSTRFLPKVRSRRILEAAIAEAERVGFLAFTREGVAARARCTPGLVTYYFESMGDLRTAVMRAAIRGPHLSILVQGLAVGHAVALTAPPKLRQQAAALLACS